MQSLMMLELFIMKFNKMNKEKEPVYDFSYTITGDTAEIKLDGKYYDEVDLTALVEQWIDDEIENNEDNIRKWYDND